MLVVALAVVIFVAYPAATYLAVAVTAAATAFATGPRATPRRGLMIGVVVVTLLAIAFLNLRATSDVVDEYFRDVGKQSNVETRLDLWREGLRQVQSPLLGSSVR